jgi:hypothetical protein
MFEAPNCARAGSLLLCMLLSAFVAHSATHAQVPSDRPQIRITLHSGAVVEGELVDRLPKGYLVKKSDGSAVMIVLEDVAETSETPPPDGARDGATVGQVPAGAEGATAPSVPASRSSAAGASQPAPPTAAAPAHETGGYGDEDSSAADVESAKFNVGRLVVEILVSGVGGGAAAYGTYVAICQDDPCFGGAMAGMGVNILATPLLAWGTGELMGGDGSLLLTFGAGLLGFTATAPISSDNPMLALQIALAVMPILAPIGYEITSHVRAGKRERARELTRLSPTLVPLRAKDGAIDGALLAVRGWL